MRRSSPTPTFPLAKSSSLSLLVGYSFLLALAATGVACIDDPKRNVGSAAAGQGGSEAGSAGRASEAGSPGEAGEAGSAGNAGEAGAAGNAGEAGSAGDANEATAGSPNGGTSANGGASGSPSAGTGGGSTDGSHWVGTWTASPYLAASDAQPPAPLSNAVLRQVTHVSLGGSSIRVLFSNRVGNGPVTIKSAHVAVCKSTIADSSIDTSTDRALAFGGVATVTIAPGTEVWSDPVAFTMAGLSNVSITTAFGSVPSSLTAHAGSRTTSYVVPASSDVSAANLLTTSQGTDHWYYISGIDVMADASAKGIVAIGDSITDGRGTDTNKNNRWTDVLAARLSNNPATANVSVMNQGIGATTLIGGGTAAQTRFARDVLGQSGVKYAIILDGVNDIGGGASFASMKTVYDGLISSAHAKGVLVFGATITPFGGSSYYSVAHESVRTQVNAYIKGGAFDGFIDFDTAVSDGGSPPKLAVSYATWAQTDGLHPGPAGNQKMGDTPDLTLFTQ